MKKLIVIIFALILALTFASCINIYQNTPSSKQSSAIPPPSQQIGNSPEASVSTQINTVLICAHGDLIGGWSNGKWITHSEAAALWSSNIKFYKYGIAGYSGTVDSSKLTEQPNGGYIFSQTTGMGENEYDENGSFTLETWPEVDYGYYETDPFSAFYLYTIPPESLNQMDVMDNTDDLIPIIQQMIDDNIGVGAAEAQILTAVSGDIDGDGEYEKVVNADNCAGLIYENINNLYSISIIIESDGSIVSLYESYVGENSEEFSNIEFVYCQNIIDIDSDGKCEIVLDGSAWEASWTQVYTYSGLELSKVLIYGVGA